MTLPGLVAAKNLADVADNERAWDNLGLNISATFFKVGGLDADASAYIDAVALADGGNYTEPGVQFAINNFIVGCKADGTWNAIKASCILAGARTLAGALVPLVGTAPTNNNFVAGDYNRKTGLVGDGSTKYLNSNRNNNADPQNNQHLASYVGTAGGGTLIGAGLNDVGTTQIISTLQRNRSSNFDLGTLTQPGFSAMSRSSASQYIFRTGSASTTRTGTSQAPFNGDLHVFRRNTISDFGWFAGRIAFYSIGESLDLALLDARVTTLINAFAAAIP